jgi:hypothetical protein
VAGQHVADRAAAQRDDGADEAQAEAVHSAACLQRADLLSVGAACPKKKPRGLKNPCGCFV